MPEPTAEQATLDDLRAAPLNAVLVDRIGLAWQVTALGADTLWHKAGANTRRNGFVQAGNHMVYEVEAMAACLPMRLVDDGRPNQ